MSGGTKVHAGRTTRVFHVHGQPQSVCWRIKVLFLATWCFSIALYPYASATNYLLANMRSEGV